MKRAVICSLNPERFAAELPDYSIMIIDPAAPAARLRYLLDRADYSLLITDTETRERNGGDYPGERLLWATSGTTGDSKFCSYTQEQLDIKSDTIIKDYELTANDRYVGIMPLWHAQGQAFYWATKKVACECHFLPVKRIKEIQQYSPTFLTGFPDLIGLTSRFLFDSLRFIRTGSAPLPDSQYLAFRDHFQVPVLEGFGMTETLSHCFTNPLRGEQRMGTIGLPTGIQADIRDGQLWLQGPTVFQPGWYATGDLAEMDAAGYYKITGRYRDQINIRGIKFNPVSLENQLTKAIPALRECVIFGSDSINCLYTGEVHPDLVRQTLIGIDPILRPAHLEQLATEIPKTPAGKISRTWLTKNYS